jgi:hypothetical protein
MRIGARVAIAAAAATLAIISLASCGSSDRAPTLTGSGSASPTPPPGIIANTFDDAVRLWKPIFNIHGSTLHIAHVNTASYVETTVAQARAMFEPDRPYSPGDWGVPESSLVWVIVAYGQFQPTGIGVTPTSGVLTTAWAAVVEGGIGTQNSYSNQQYGLSQLGTPHELDPAVLNSAD